MLSLQYLSGARPALSAGLYSSPGLSSLITGQERIGWSGAGMAVLRTLGGESAGLLWTRGVDFRPQSWLSITDAFPQLCGLHRLPPSEWSTCTRQSCSPLSRPPPQPAGLKLPLAFLKGHWFLFNLYKSGMLNLRGKTLPSEASLLLSQRVDLKVETFIWGQKRMHRDSQ